MGCHTWTYKRIPFTGEILEEHKWKVRKRLDNSLIYGFFDFLKTEEIDTSEFDEEDFKEHRKWYNWLASKADDDEFMERIYQGEPLALLEIDKFVDIHPEDSDNYSEITLTVFDKDGNLYLCYYDKNPPPFRVDDYPEGIFTNASELIEFLKTYYNNPNKTLTDNLKKPIKFQESGELPKEIIDWIVEFFKNNDKALDFG